MDLTDFWELSTRERIRHNRTVLGARWPAWVEPQLRAIEDAHPAWSGWYHDEEPLHCPGRAPIQAGSLSVTLLRPGWRYDPQLHAADAVTLARLIEREEACWKGRTPVRYVLERRAA